MLFKQKLIAATLFLAAIGNGYAQEAPASAPTSGTDTAAVPSSAASAPAVASGVDYHKGYSMGAHNDYLFRWQEDYSYLSNPALSNDLFDPLKYIPLSSDGKNYLSLNAGLRLMYDHNLTNVLNTPFGGRDDFYSRATVGADLHLGEHFRAYVEGIDGQYAGTSPVPGITTTNLALYNAFAEFMGKAGDTKYGLRIGRQQLWLGNSVIIGPNELTNIPTTQNGVDGYADWGKGRIDIFDVMPTSYGGSGIGDTNTGSHMSGIYSSFDLPEYSLFGPSISSTIEPFLIRFTASNGSYYGADLELSSPSSVGPPAFVAGRDERNMIGLRYFGTMGSMDFDWTAAYQGGNFAGRPVHAWMFATSTGYEFKNVSLSPHIALQIDGASGGSSSGSLRTYQPLYDMTPYYSEALAVAPVNMIDVAPHFQIHPLPRFTIEAYWGVYWRQSMNDAIYGGPFGGPTYVNPYAGSAGHGSRYIGDQPTLAFRWRATKHVFADLTLADFRPGPTLRSMGGTNTPWVLLFVDLSF